jgi:peroxiredoxin (alkyl hydroperoxide reductase subunit C)
MKKSLIVMLFVTLSVTAMSQADSNSRIPLIGETAPSFVAESTNGSINFPADLGKSWKILFSHPQDFTPVCSSEILELANAQGEFEKLNTKLVVISTDELKTHKLWKTALEEMKYKDRETLKINFPLVDDNSKAVAKKYGMIHPASSSTKGVRGVFIIDPNNVVQAIYFYPMNVGRSTTELLRAVSALQTASKEYATPADWNKGDDFLVTVPPADALDNTKPAPAGYYRPSWFMLFKKGTND